MRVLKKIGIMQKLLLNQQYKILNVFLEEGQGENKIFRQNDKSFQNILNQIRVGKLDENSKKILSLNINKPKIYIQEKNKINLVVDQKYFPISSNKVSGKHK